MITARSNNILSNGMAAVAKVKTEVVEKKVRGFQPGKSGNPKGRPKGSYCERTLRYIEMKDNASKSARRVLEIILELCEAKERWAIELYCSKFIPDKDGERTVFIDDLATGSTDEQIQSLISKAPEFGEFTKKEMTDYLKILGGIKVNENIAAMDINNRLSQETLFKQLEAINNVIDIKRELEEQK